MPQYQILMLSSELVKLLFVFSLGACIGSLTNVLVYRMPLGLSVVTPSSRCPKCQTKLRWNDNIPILGWLVLRGRCRYCKCRISPEYPIVELIGGLLFVVPFFLFYSILNFQMLGWETVWLGVDWATLAPEWSGRAIGLEHSWPIFLVILVLLGCLLPATIIDARTFMIPLMLTWIPAVVAVVVLPATAAWHESIRASTGRAFAWADGWTWAIASPGETGWKWVGGSIGTTVGLGVSMVMLKLGLLKRSFADYDEWEEKALAEAKGTETDSKGSSANASSDSAEKADEPPAAEPALGETTENSSDESSPDSDGSEGEKPAESEDTARTAGGVVSFAIVLVSCVAGAFVANALGFIAFGGVVVGLLVGPILAGVVQRLRSAPSSAADMNGSDKSESEAESPAAMWLAYPHARRETFLELSFLGMPALLALIGWVMVPRLAGPWQTDPTTYQQIPAHMVPLWLDVLAGVLMGYLVGGGVVWAVRIFGTLGFGKEAMGLGDVHLMAGVGACLGWIDPTLAFFLAAFVALYLTFVSVVWAGEGRRAMPFGPALVIATLLIFLGKVGVEMGINAWLGRVPPNLINLP